MSIVAPSLLAANFGNLQKDIEMVNDSEADWFHIDIMDGQFVPNFSIGTPVVQAINRIAKKPLDVHLMVVDPDRYVPLFAELGASLLTVHYEACTHLHRTVHHIKELNMKAGVCLNPHTPVHLLNDILPDVDLVLIMSVNPGYGGQSFIPGSLSKIKKLNEMKQESGLDFFIEVDGGVDLKNAKPLVEAGVNVLVAGNTVFSSANPIETISILKNA
ncbi:MAG: ribulose-phosphate 3-epimerase [Bacteroidales bacterium]|nr:ribulose-phosphate 3-epimerase [Bacteroidales bacterium]